VLVFVQGDSGANVRQYKQVCEKAKAKVRKEASLSFEGARTDLLSSTAREEEPRVSRVRSRTSAGIVNDDAFARLPGFGLRRGIGARLRCALFGWVMRQCLTAHMLSICWRSQVEVWEAAQVVKQWPAYQAKLTSSDKKWWGSALSNACCAGACVRHARMR
jgi:hypothetical protein